MLVKKAIALLFLLPLFFLEGSESELANIDDCDSCIKFFEESVALETQNAKESLLQNAKGELDIFLKALEIAKYESYPQLPTLGWNLYPKYVKVIHYLNHPKIALESTFEQDGFIQGTIASSILWNRFLNQITNAKTIPIFVEDHAKNYTRSDLSPEMEEILNASHEYCLIDEPLKTCLRPILEQLKDPVYRCLGTPFRIVNVRIWRTSRNVVEEGPMEWHVDGFPTSLLKVMIYPYGANSEKGTIELKNQGRITRISGPMGTYLIFKNSEVYHRAIAPRTGKRLAIEVTLAPALEFDLEPYSAGLNARHPLIAWQKLPTPSYLDNPNLIGLNINGSKGGLNWALLDAKSFDFHSHCNFPYRDSSVPLAYTSEAFSCQNEATIHRILSETQRILKTGGNFVIKMPDYDRALECWRSFDKSFFDTVWNIESIIWTWKNKEVCDCLDNRASMLFASFWNEAFTQCDGIDDFDGTYPYFGPAKADTAFLRKLIHNSTPSQICKSLTKIIKSEKDYQLFHKSAWGRSELLELLTSYGFELVSFDSAYISRVFHQIPEIDAMRNQNLYLWVRKK